MSTQNIIEIIGVAGSGKSYVCQKLGSSPWPPVSRSLSRQIRATWRALPALKTMTRLEYGHIDCWLNSRLKFDQWQNLRDFAIQHFILDEGPWHFLIGSLLPRVKAAQHQQIIHEWHFYMDLPDTIIYLRCAPEQILAQRTQRGREKEKSLDLTVIQQTINMYETNLERLKRLYPHAQIYEYEAHTALENIFRSGLIEGEASQARSH